MDETKNIQVRTQDNKAFFAHDASINFNPTILVVDFKCVTPRLNILTNENVQTLIVEHNVIMLQPEYAKKFHEGLGESIKEYEKSFGKIKTKNYKVEKVISKIETIEATKPSYFG